MQAGLNQGSKCVIECKKRKKLRIVEAGVTGCEQRAPQCEVASARSRAECYSRDGRREHNADTFDENKIVFALEYVHSEADAGIIVAHSCAQTENWRTGFWC